MSTSPEKKAGPLAGVEAWRKQHRFQLQSAALILALAAPFALYWALESGQAALAAACFAVIALSMAVVAWAG
jgi:hypothetical protein